MDEVDLEIVGECEEREEVDSLLAKGKGQCLIMPHLAQQILRKMWAKDGKVLRKVFRCLGEIDDTQHPTDMFFLTAILVPPSRFRPVSCACFVPLKKNKKINTFLLIA